MCISTGRCEGWNRVSNRSSFAPDGCTGSRPAVSPSAVEDVEGTSPKNDEIVESNRSVVCLIWFGSAVTYVDAAFGLVVVATVVGLGTEVVVVPPSSNVVV